MHLLSAIRILGVNEALATCCFGTSYLFDDKDAFIVDMADSRALTAVLRLTEQAVFVNPRTALIATSVPSGVWCPEITEKAKAHRLLTIKAVRWRDGRAYARPWELPDMSRTRANKENRRENPDLFIGDPFGTTTLSIVDAPSFLSTGDQTILLVNICKVLGKSSMPVVSGDPYAPNPDGTKESIRIVLNHEGAWTGRVKLTFTCEEDHKDAQKRLHGGIVTVGRRKLSVEVSHDFFYPKSPADTVTRGVNQRVPTVEEGNRIQCAAKATNGMCDTANCPVCNAPGGAAHKGVL